MSKHENDNFDLTALSATARRKLGYLLVQVQGMPTVIDMDKKEEKLAQKKFNKKIKDHPTLNLIFEVAHLRKELRQWRKAGKLLLQSRDAQYADESLKYLHKSAALIDNLLNFSDPPKQSSTRRRRHHKS